MGVRYSWYYLCVIEKRHFFSERVTRACTLFLHIKHWNELFRSGCCVHIVPTKNECNCCYYSVDKFSSAARESTQTRIDFRGVTMTLKSLRGRVDHCPLPTLLYASRLYIYHNSSGCRPRRTTGCRWCVGATHDWYYSSLHYHYHLLQRLKYKFVRTTRFISNLVLLWVEKPSLPRCIQC